MIDESTPFTPEDDNYHVPSDDPYEYESTWWSLNVPERRLGLWLHAGRHSNRGTATWRVFAWDPSGAYPAQLAYYKLVNEAPMEPNPDLRDVTFPQGGFSVKMLRPLTDYAISYADPEVGFAVDIEHHSVHPPHRFTPGEAPFVNNPHLDQLGHVVGTVTLRGERIPVDCWSVRDRSWGPRGGHHGASQKKEYVQGQHRVAEPGGAKWREVERQRGRGRIQYIFGHVDDTTGFLGFVRPQDGDARGWSPMRVGWLLKDGEFQRLEAGACRMRVHRDPATGWTSHMEVDLTDRTGRRMEVEGVAMSRISEIGAGAHSLMRWEMDGKIGWGEDQDVWRPDHFRLMLAALQASR